LHARIALPLPTNERIDHLKSKGCSVLADVVPTVEKVFIVRALLVASSMLNSSVAKHSKTRRGDIKKFSLVTR
jgi:hypothetical protein